jgi:hypothetical protein
MLSLIVVCGCSQGHTSDEGEYLSWLNDPDHGLVQVRAINGLHITVKYMPPDYRAYRELGESESSHDREVVEKRCEGSVNLLLSISRDTTAPSRGEIDPHMVIQQGMILNEEIKEHLSLRADGIPHAPVITALDNNAGMSGVINITAVFVDEQPQGKLLHAKQYDVIFDDRMFGTGISHFLFSREAIDRRMRFDF